MKNSIQIFKRDLKSILKNPVALIIVIGVAILPSLYAWVNILASWDPYSNTSTIKVAIVNEDVATNYEGNEINTGAMVVDNLKENDKIDWDFVDSDTAQKGLLKGYYIASITISKDFSKDLISFISEDDAIKPTITYRVNTKENPVLSKISDAAQRTLVQTIKSNFILEVNKVAFDRLNKIGTEIGNYEKEIIGLKQSLLVLNSNMDFITSSLNNASATTETLNVYLKSLKTSIPSIITSIDQIQDNNKNELITAEENKNNALNSIDQYEASLINLENQIMDLNEIVEDLTLNSVSPENIKNKIEIIENLLNLSNEQTNETIKFLQGLKNFMPDDANEIDNLISSLNNYSNDIDNELSQLNDFSNQYQESSKEIEAIIKNIALNNASSVDEIKNKNNEYNEVFIETINKIYDNYVDYNKNQNESLAKIKENLNSYDSILNISTTQLENSGNLTIDALDDLNYFRDSIDFLANSLSLISDEDIKTIITILKSDPETMAYDLTNPFNIIDEAIYPLENYGSGMTPMYSSLAMWVGALILTSVFNTEVKDDKYSDFSIKDKHLGKMMLFVFVAFLQGLTLMIGNKLFLGVQTSNLFIFISFGIYISICFSVIIYTNVSLFKDFGKALNVILLVLQIAGSGGSYPIQLDPLFFRTLYRFFPFTYALGIIRESVNGILISALVYDIFILTFITAIFFVAGLFFKEKIHHIVEKFDEKFEDSKIGE